MVWFLASQLKLRNAGKSGAGSEGDRAVAVDIRVVVKGVTGHNSP